jgi:oligosaccharide repeat unit polymerase
MMADRQIDIKITKLLFITLIFVSISIISKLNSKYFELYFTAALVLYIIFFLAVYSGAIKWYGTLFLFILFSTFQFIAILVPTFFDFMPYFRFFSDSGQAEEYFIKYLFIFLFGFFFLIFGYSFGKKIRVIKAAIKCNDFPLFICFLPFIISSFAFYKIFSMGGGMLVLAAITGSEIEAVGELGVFISLTKIGYISSCMLLLTRKYKYCGVTFFVLTIFNAGIGERGALLFSGIIPLLITYRLSHGKIQTKYIAIMGTLFLLFYLVIGAVRGVKEGSDIQNEDFSSSVIQVLAKTEHHINAAATIQMADKEGFYWGKTLYNLIYVPMPRSQWKNKPVTAESGVVGMQLKKTNIVKGSGLPPGVFAYSYLQFGYFGVIFMPFFAGVFCGVAEYYFLNSKSFSNILFYSQSQALFVHLFSTEVQVKLLMNFVTVSLVVILSVCVTSLKDKLNE